MRSLLAVSSLLLAPSLAAQSMGVVMRSTSSTSSPVRGGTVSLPLGSGSLHVYGSTGERRFAIGPRTCDEPPGSACPVYDRRWDNGLLGLAWVVPLRPAEVGIQVSAGPMVEVLKRDLYQGRGPNGARINAHDPIDMPRASYRNAAVGGRVDLEIRLTGPLYLRGDAALGMELYLPGSSPSARKLLPYAASGASVLLRLR